MSKGDEGASVYLTATVKDGQKMEFEGYSYLFGKKEGKWEVTNGIGLKVGDGKKITLEKDEWKTKFPKAGRATGTDTFKRKFSINDYWDFLENNGEKLKESVDNTSSNSNLWWRWEVEKYDGTGIYFPKN